VAVAPAERCSASSLAAGEPLAGTAPAERAFLCVEQQPPWGRDAVRESGLDRDVAERLLERARHAGVRVLLVRPALDGRPPRRRVFLSWTGPDGFLVEHEVGEPRELLGLDLEALGRGARPAIGAGRAAPLFLVCTNGRRDACCARHGCAAAAALAAELPGDAWECTHLGGHRFAATMLALPSGYCYGRLDEMTAVEAARELRAGELAVERLRGRAGLHPALQAAEVAVRDALGLRGLGEVEPLELGGDGRAIVEARGERLAVRMEERVTAPLRASCGREPEPERAWVAAEPPRPL
jgi:hypothetical protein